MNGKITRRRLSGPPGALAGGKAAFAQPASAACSTGSGGCFHQSAR
jgi:hypothetical protein